MFENKYDRYCDSYYSVTLNAACKAPLLDGEMVLHIYKPQKKAYVMNRIVSGMWLPLIWLTFDIMFILNFLSGVPTSTILQFMLPLIAFFAVHLMPVWRWIADIFKSGSWWQQAEYILTDKRVLVRSGFTGPEFDAIYYQSIKSVELKIGSIDKICGVGDIHLDTIAGKMILYDVENPQLVYQDIERSVEYAKLHYVDTDS